MTVVFVNPLRTYVGAMMYVFDNEGVTVGGTRHWICWDGQTTSRRDAVRDQRVGELQLDLTSLEWIRECRARIEQLIRSGEILRTTLSGTSR